MSPICRLVSRAISLYREHAGARRAIVVPLQVALGLAGLGYVIANLTSASAQSPDDFTPRMAATVAALVLFGIVGLTLKALRWRVWLNVGPAEHVSLVWCIRIMIAARFVGAISIGSVAADVYRVGSTVGSGRTLRRSVTAAVLDRLSGAATYSVVAAGTITALATESVTAALAVGVAAAGVVAIATAVVHPSGPMQLAPRVVRGARQRVRRLVADVGGRPFGRAVITSVTITIAHTALEMAAVFTAALLIGAPMRIDQSLAVALVRSAVAMIPWALQGLGLRDASLFAVLTQFGMLAPSAALVSVVMRASGLAVAVAGGLTYLGGRLPPGTNRLGRTR